MKTEIIILTLVLILTLSVRAEQQTSVHEQVKCSFTGTERSQTCYTYIDNQEFKCEGSESCIVEVTGTSGSTLTWTSTCGNYATSQLDGIEDTVEFLCPSETENQLPVEAQRETVKCLFSESTTEQKCYALSSQGEFSCTGVETCTLDVGGFQGEKITWKSSCKGYDYTIMDGEEEYVKFDCGQSSETSEQVKCVFKGDLIPIKSKCGDAVCSSQESCSSCSVDCGSCEVSSSAGGGYSVGAGGFSPENINSQTVQYIPNPNVYQNLDYEKLRRVTIVHRKHFTCDGQQLDEQLGFGNEEVINVKERHYTNYVCKNRYQEQCVDDGSYDSYYDEWCEYDHVATPVEIELPIEQLKQECYVYTSKGKVGCSGVQSCVAKVSGNSGEKITWKSSCGGYAYTVLDGSDEYAEFTCGQETNVQEQVKCLFKGATSEQECYAVSEKNEKLSCTGIESCTIDVSGKKGSKVVWKSSCGGYAFTLLDGESEYAGFDCSMNEVPELSQQQGFEYASWTCEDGRTQVSEKGCRSAETWKKLAEKDCGKIKEFSVAKSCYSDEQENQINENDLSIFQNEETKIEALVCKDSCPSEGKCYPFGYRKASQFCSDKGSFEAQWEPKTQCENSFECNSNLCVSNECVSPSFIEKVTKWFDKLFGKDN